MEKTEQVTKNPLTARIGDKDIPILNPAKVKILDVTLQPKKEGKFTLVNLTCRHPEREDLISISKIKVQDGERLKVLTTWMSLDEDEQLQKGSAPATLVEFLEVKSLKELEGKEIMTVEESKDSKYLVLKCYK